METRRLELSTAGSTTQVWVGAGALEETLPQIGELIDGRRIFAVTSPALMRLYRGELEAVAERASVFEVIEVADGEAAKSIETAHSLWRRLLVGGGKRDSLILAFGGGSIGDLAGFVAATFLRGVDFVQIPTTLLAQVDAAIGGKTAINLPEAKNSVGAFHHPVAVISDTRFLETLSPRQIRSGLFEVVKTAVMLDAELFGALEERLDSLLTANAEALAPIVHATASAKMSVVEKDPREGNLRRLLNFGHTLGHALESEAMAREGRAALEHGEAVAHGMLFALELAEARGMSAEIAGRVRGLIDRVGVPPVPSSLCQESVRSRLGRDKKAREAALAWVLPREIGVGEIVEDLPIAEVERRLVSFFADSGC